MCWFVVSHRILMAVPVRLCCGFFDHRWSALALPWDNMLKAQRLIETTHPACVLETGYSLGVSCLARLPKAGDAASAPAVPQPKALL